MPIPVPRSTHLTPNNGAVWTALNQSGRAVVGIGAFYPIPISAIVLVGLVAAIVRAYLPRSGAGK